MQQLARAAMCAVMVAQCAARLAPAQTRPAPGASERDRAWREDLHVLAEQLPQKHILPFLKISREEFAQMVAELDEKIPQLSDAQIQVGMLQLVARLGDSHTTLELNAKKYPFHVYPFIFYWFADGPFIVATSPKHRDLLGAQLIDISSVNFDTAAARVATVFPYENDASLKKNLPQWMNLAEVLHAVELSDDPRSCKLGVRTRAGREIGVALEASPAGVRVEWVRLPDSAPSTQPVSVRHRQKVYSFEYLPESKLLYCAYNSCRNDPNEPLEQFAARLLECLDSNTVEKLVIDLRRNGGGDSSVAQPLIERLRKHQQINRKGRLFVLIGRGTYSSAQLNGNDFRKRTRAVLVGEPTGQKPNAFGEIRSFTLPNSGAKVWYSTKYFRTQLLDTPSMMPDIHAEPKFEDFLAGRDVVMEAVLAYPGK